MRLLIGVLPLDGVAGLVKEEPVARLACVERVGGAVGEDRGMVQMELVRGPDAPCQVLDPLRKAPIVSSACTDGIARSKKMARGARERVTVDPPEAGKSGGVVMRSIIAARVGEKRCPGNAPSQVPAQLFP